MYDLIQAQPIVSYGTPATVVAANGTLALPSITLSPAFDHVDLTFNITNASATSDATHGCVNAYLTWTYPDGTTGTSAPWAITVINGGTGGERVMQNAGLFFAAGSLAASASAQSFALSIHRAAGNVTTGLAGLVFKNATAIAASVSVSLSAGSADGFTYNSGAGRLYTTSAIQASSAPVLAL